MLFIISVFILIRLIKPFLKAITNNESQQLIIVLGGDIKREIIGMEMPKT